MPTRARGPVLIAVLRHCILPAVTWPTRHTKAHPTTHTPEVYRPSDQNIQHSSGSSASNLAQIRGYQDASSVSDRSPAALARLAIAATARWNSSS
ncbi:MAG: hypothetical protein AAGB48_11045, partial [Planctomycetota bacterium]